MELTAVLVRKLIRIDRMLESKELKKIEIDRKDRRGEKRTYLRSEMDSRGQVDLRGRERSRRGGIEGVERSRCKNVSEPNYSRECGKEGYFAC